MKCERLGLIVMFPAAMVFAGCGSKQKPCAICKVEQCGAQFSARLTLTNGQRVETCCPRCALNYLHESKQQMQSVTVRDYETRRWLDGASATYLVGSELSHCTIVSVRRDAEGPPIFKSYDRCLPSIVAFPNHEAAEAGQKSHGGQVVSFEKLSAD